MFEKSEQMAADFDPHFTIFHKLMSFKVQNILLISSAFDAFIMEEDGSIATQVSKEYHGLSLSGAPMITRVSSVADALEQIRYKKYDLVITMPFLKGVNGFDIGREIKDICPTLPVILITHNLQSLKLPADGQHHSIDNIFLWTGGAELLVAMVKNVEDHINVIADTARAMVRVIIYVEDSPADRSFFLPLIYRELVWQTQALLDESLNEKHRLLRMRARPKVLLATSHEEASSLYEAYKPFVFCIISDTRFTVGGRMEADAGLRLLESVRGEISDLPLLLLSTESHNRQKAQSIPAVFIDKNSPSRSQELHNFFLEHLGFGDFVFRQPDQTEVGRAETIGELERMLKIIPEESLCYHATRNHFSNWIMARAEVAMARHLHRQNLAEYADGAALRKDLVDKIHILRKVRQKGVVVRFKPDRFDPEILDFVKIGEGAIGGKARGLAFMWARLQNDPAPESILSGNIVTIPKSCVISANGFESFIEDNNLVHRETMNDEEIQDRFLRARLPQWLRDNLRVFAVKCPFPLSVRSSSLLEDGLFRPFAGLYSTYFLANNSNSQSTRLEELENAIKLIYASTWFASPRAFAQNTGSSRNDAMAVIIQEVVGRNYNGYWYPAVSGVAKSYNHYPVLNMKAEEGIAHIALGLGKTVVDGEKTLRFSPAHPERLVQFSTVDDILNNCQNTFYALDMSAEAEFSRSNSNLVLRQVQDAAKEYPVQQLSSTYVAEEHRIRDGFMPGMRIMTFAQLLKYNIYPMARIVSELLEIGREGMGCEVEMEFAVNLAEDPRHSVFYFLQMRPMVAGGEGGDVDISAEDVASAVCYSSQCLGHGRFTNCADILLVKPDVFDPARTRAIASEIGALNSTLEKQSRRYVLIGPGRWGTADRWLGIPVQWRDISAVGAMVEIRNKALRAEPSQGSHFFQNITSLGIPYLTVTEEDEEPEDSSSGPDERERVDWQWLLAAEPVESTRYVSHLRLPSPLTIKCDGKSAKGVIIYARGDS